MATSVSPILRSTVIWFGSLEFMSTDLAMTSSYSQLQDRDGLASCPHNRRPRDGLTTMPPCLRGGAISTVTTAP